MILRRWRARALVMRARSAAVARGKRRASAMLLAGHFSVWAVSAAAATMQEKERDKARLDTVMPFVTARKVRVMRDVL